MDTQIKQSILRREVLFVNALCAVAAGALLGALGAMPYNQLIGLSDTACTVVRSLVAAGVLVGLGARRPFVLPGQRDLVFEPEETQSR
jgi:quinol-cytochrome oxidoreductase complex cytochrome b subunit